MKLWIARDKDGCLWVYESQPIKFEEKYFIDIEENSVDTLGAELPEKWFPEVTFENSPKQIKIELL
jgi:hypothetical protein